MSDPSGPRRPEAPLAEWLVAALGLLLVLATVGFLVYEELSGADRPPDLGLERGEISETSYGYLVPVTVYNRGGRTVAALGVTGTLERNGEPLETSEATIDYVPTRSSRQVGLLFRHDPRGGTLELELGGYQEP